jgi:UDP-N-acetylmuramate--alanine ligase
MKHAIRNIHFIGVGGSGMSGIAEVLLNLGYQISGSDLADSATLRRLAGLGITTHVGHAAGNVKDADAVVTSTAVKADNPEVLAARERHIPIVPRAVMLAELMRLKQGVAIAGTHGKTTTTSLVASVLAEAGLDPTFVIGGRLNSAGANAKLGTGDYIVVEADESDASFLNLLPVMAVVTNIDADHMETYGHDFGRLKSAFVDFLHRMPFYGTAIVCTDDPGVQAIADEIARPVTSYGLNEGAQVRALNVRAEHGQMHFTVQRRNGVTLPDLPVVLNLPGEHNVRNALAAIAVAVELNVPDDAVLRALAQFKGVGRRFQRYGEVRTADGQGRFTVIDDYGHHPVEMAATLAAARGAFPGRRLVLAFQPHRYAQRARQRAAVGGHDGRFARGIDLGQQHAVAALANDFHKVFKAITRAAVAVGLERQHQPATRERPTGGRQRGRHLDRVVSVIVDDREAPSASGHAHLAIALKTASHRVLILLVFCATELLMLMTACAAPSATVTACCAMAMASLAVACAASAMAL